MDSQYAGPQLGDPFIVVLVLVVMVILETIVINFLYIYMILYLFTVLPLWFGTWRCSSAKVKLH